MLKTLKQRKSEKGAVTIEATIALTTFLFMFMMIFSVITICRAQAHIQIAINATAKELSQYSYLYGLTGLDGPLNKLQDSANSTKDEIDGTITNVANVFSSLEAINTEGQNLVGQMEGGLDVANIDGAMDSWETVKTELGKAETSATSIKESLEAYAENPQELLFGMARLLASESLELAKSRLIAEPICRALVKKHLKRYDDDTAEAFCQSVGIVPGTYLGKESSFNGLDFSNSTLFPYGSDEINIVVTYKVKILQLLPVDLDFTITQSAVTKGWLHGDMSAGANSSNELLTAMIENDESLWNSPEKWGDIKSQMISAEVENLKAGDYYGISCETYLHAYDPDTNTFAMVSALNPLYGVDSVQDIDKKTIQDELEKYEAQMNSTVTGKQYITVKRLDENGNYIKEDIDCSGTSTKKIVVVIPEDDELLGLMEQIVTDMETDVQFEFKQSYGSVYVDRPKEEKTEVQEGE